MNTIETTVGGIPVLKMAGHSHVMGIGPTLYTYSVFIEPTITSINKRRFTRTVESILGDERGWIRGGKVSFQRVDTDAKTYLVLATPDTTDQLCYPLKTEGYVSCCNGARVIINIDRWTDAVPHWPGTIKSYRQMLINHEFGHRIGKPHAYCSGVGDIAPVMQQQTYGLQECKANSWPLSWEL